MCDPCALLLCATSNGIRPCLCDRSFLLYGLLLVQVAAGDTTPFNPLCVMTQALTAGCDMLGLSSMALYCNGEFRSGVHALLLAICQAKKNFHRAGRGAMYTDRWLGPSQNAGQVPKL